MLCVRESFRSVLSLLLSSSTGTKGSETALCLSNCVSRLRAQRGWAGQGKVRATWGHWPLSLTYSFTSWDAVQTRLAGWRGGRQKGKWRAETQRREVSFPWSFSLSSEWNRSVSVSLPPPSALSPRLSPPLSLLLLGGPLSITRWVRNGWHSYSFEAVPGRGRRGMPLALLKLLRKLFQSPPGSTWGPLCCPGPCPWAPVLKGSTELMVITGDSSWHSPILPF